MTRNTKKKTDLTDPPRDPMRFGPRFPWESSTTPVEKASQTASRGHDADSVDAERNVRNFAEAGKIDVLDRIRELRNRMDRVFLERETYSKRVAELEEECEGLGRDLDKSKEAQGVCTAQLKAVSEDRDKLRLLVRELEEGRLAAAKPKPDAGRSESRPAQAPNEKPIETSGE